MLFYIMYRNFKKKKKILNINLIIFLLIFNFSYNIMQKFYLNIINIVEKIFILLFIFTEL